VSNMKNRIASLICFKTIKSEPRGEGHRINKYL
jgi:hypothetical protein